MPKWLHLWQVTRHCTQAQHTTICCIVALPAPQASSPASRIDSMQGSHEGMGVDTCEEEEDAPAHGAEHGREALADDEREQHVDRHVDAGTSGARLQGLNLPACMSTCVRAGMLAVHCLHQAYTVTDSDGPTATSAWPMTARSEVPQRAPILFQRADMDHSADMQGDMTA